MVYRLISFLGVFFIIGIVFLLSKDKKKVNLRLVLWGIGLQFLFGVLILKTEIGKVIFNYGKIFFNQILSFSDTGTQFLFGKLYLGVDTISHNLGMSGPFQLLNAETGNFEDMGLIFAIHILPTIIFFASLMAILYHLGVMQFLVKLIARVMVKFMGTSGAESLSVAANIFVGQTEAPVVVRPFLMKMTQSELFTVMVGGFATIAGGVMAAYIKFGVDAGHMMSATVMSAPAAIVMSKIMIPETEKPETQGNVNIKIEKNSENLVDAATIGARDGLMLALNVGAMLIAFISLIAMLNYLLGFSDDLLNLMTFGKFDFDFNLTLAKIFSVVFAPFAFFMGVPLKDVPELAQLLGVKVSVTELMAYLDLVSLKSQIEPRTFLIATYALCGFANLGSVAIQIGGISALVPERRKDLSKLAIKAMFAGALASWSTAAIAGVLL